MKKEIKNFIQWRDIVIIGIGIMVRFLFLGKGSLWFDEASSYLVSSSSLLVLFKILDIAELTPPLFFILLHGIIRINDSILWMRLFPAIMGGVNVWLFYKVAKIYCGDKYLIPLIIGVFSPFWIHESQNIRMYSLLLTLVLASIIIFDKMLNSENNKNYYLFILFNTLGLYTHYFYGFFYLAEIITLFLKKRHFKYTYLLVFVPLCLFSPWINHIIHGLQNPYIFWEYNPWSLFDHLRLFGEFVTDSNFATWSFTGFSAGVGCVIILIFVIGIYIFIKQKKYYQTLFIILNILIPITTMYCIILLLEKSIMKPRYFIAMTPFIYITIGYCITQAVSYMVRFLRIAVLSCLIFFCGVYFWSRVHIDARLDLYASSIMSMYQKGDSILHVEMWHYLPLRYYYLKKLPQFLVLIKPAEEYLFLGKNIPLINHSIIQTTDKREQQLGEYVIVVDPLKRFGMQKVSRMTKNHYWAIINR